MIVLDASAAVDYLIDNEPRATWVTEHVLADGQSLHAPSLLDVEVASALWQLHRRGSITVRRAEQALGDLLKLRVHRYQHRPLLARMWRLRDSVRMSDSAYVALAELLGAPLVTTDARLSRYAGHQAQIEAFDG